MSVRLKVCGMARPDNLRAVAALRPDFLGFIFYPKSRRYATPTLTPADAAAVPATIRKVGVFVDEDTAVIQERITQYGLQAVQLHGTETPETCALLRATGVVVIKAFAIGAQFDFAQLLPYVGQVDFFLFDTAGAHPGGNGTAFDWQLLADYSLPVPYFLAGGLALEHADLLRNLQLPGLFALDLNSKFETEPGVKDANLLRQMFQQLRP
ncbi:phosphoribosylanthranilate isomerase [Hymenobacter glacieicola]|uniref:N-(5'-phosphoribosyl)anthranilate isomerase n=1 Tax=Hymenobacter glacieicola TaxID=1562124 RepID=A0ABQ1WPS1_9BACT|nr:phosphoribosylanthranilate isomerase [Hymenobacter glacieicola]GGG41439.1 N-(5'-phosphoribosyl)anthranilate isomerase [Hymenobacter glacieicola]